MPPLMDKLTPVLPCRGRDDLNEPRSTAQADELLAAWTALWHPAIVAAVGSMPRWTAARAARRAGRTSYSSRQRRTAPAR